MGGDEGMEIGGQVGGDGGGGGGDRGVEMVGGNRGQVGGYKWGKWVEMWGWRYADRWVEMGGGNEKAGVWR